MNLLDDLNSFKLDLPLKLNDLSNQFESKIKIVNDEIAKTSKTFKNKIEDLIFAAKKTDKNDLNSI
jgi:hypothetical protein